LTVAKDKVAKVPINPQNSAAAGIGAANLAVLSPLIAGLFPAGVVAAELRAAGDPSLLHESEAKVVLRAVPKRVGEFAAGRLCARRALAELGVTGFAVLAAEDRRPLWPAHLVGSITHTDGFCAAVGAERARFGSLGIDTEHAEGVKPELWPRICIEQESTWVASLEPGAQPRAVALIFSAKEAFYKCQYPVTGQHLNFWDLEVTPLDWGQASGSFSIAPTRPILAPPREGKFRFHEAFISTGVFLPP
jgi:4'-phosphopantetheinyl transferase EntD